MTVAKVRLFKVRRLIGFILTSIKELTKMQVLPGIHGVSLTMAGV